MSAKCRERIGRHPGSIAAKIKARFRKTLPGADTPGKCLHQEPTERSRGFLENLVDVARDRLGAFAGDLLAKSCEFLDLFAQLLELFSSVRRPQLHNIGW